MVHLWPEGYDTMPWSAHVNDKLEDKLHAIVCDVQERGAQQAL